MDVFDLFAKITLDTKEFKSGLSKAADLVKSVGSTIASGLGTIASTGVAVFEKAADAAFSFGQQATQVGMSFDSAMSQVAATMGKTVADMESEIATVKLPSGEEFTGNLRDYAKKMGAETAFSATQAAEALNYMALAGYDAETSMSMLPNVLNLAAAGGMELGRASDMVTDAQSALGLSLDETSELVDKMAMAASKSNTSVEQLGDAFLTVGGTAKNLAGGTTELSTVLGILADNGIKGSEGGTALRNIINSLSAPTDKASKMLEELGVSVFDADGKMRSLNDIFLDLNDAVGGMTQEGRMNVISTLFNARDMKSAEALLANVGDRYEELSGYIDQAKDSAGAMADTQLDNLQGQITLMQSALEGVQISLSEKVTPYLKDFVKIGSESLGQLVTAIENNDFDKMSDILSTALKSALKRLKEIIPEVVEAGASLVGAIVTGVADSIPELLDAGVSIFYAITRTMSESKIDIGTILSNVIKQFSQRTSQILYFARRILTMLADGITKNLPVIMTSIAQLVSDIAVELTNPQNMQAFLTASVAILKAIAQGLISSAGILLKAVPEILSNLSTAFSENQDLFGGLDFSGIFDALGRAWEKLSPIVSDIIDDLGWLWDNVLSPVIEWAVEDIAPVAIDALTGAIGLLKDAIDFLKPYAMYLWDEFLQPIAEWTGDIVTASIDLLSGALNGLASTFEDVDWEGFWAESLEDHIDDWKAGWTDIGNSLSEAGTKIDEFFNVSEFGEGWNTFWQKVGEKVFDVTDKIKTYLTGVETATDAAVQNVYKAFTGWIGFWNRTKSTVGSFVEGVKSYFNTWAEFWDDLKKNVTDFTNGISSAISGIIENAKSWGSDLVDNFVEGIQNAKEKLAEASSKLAQIVTDFLGFSEPEKGPLSNFHTYAPDMIDLFTKGMKDSKGTLISEADRIASDLSNSLTNIDTIPELTISGNVDKNGIISQMDSAIKKFSIPYEDISLNSKDRTFEAAKLEHYDSLIGSLTINVREDRNIDDIGNVIVDIVDEAFRKKQINEYRAIGGMKW